MSANQTGQCLQEVALHDYKARRFYRGMSVTPHADFSVLNIDDNDELECVSKIITANIYGMFAECQDFMYVISPDPHNDPMKH